MAYLNFDKKDDNSYDRLYIILKDSSEEKIFSSGDILKDWYCATKYFMDNFQKIEDYNLAISNDLEEYISNSEFDIMNISLNEEGKPEVTYNNVYDGFKKYTAENGWFYPVKKDDKPTIKDLVERYEWK